jgi:hypothetical protein
MKKITTLLGIFCLIFITGFSQNDVSKPIRHLPVYFDVSPPLRDMVKNAPTKADNSWKDGIVKNHIYPYGQPTGENIPVTDPNLQRWFGSVLTDTTIVNFDGNNNSQGFVPPDTQGDVSPDEYFQVVNCHYSIYSKSGVRIFGPANNSTVWNGMPNNSNDGDAVVLYDDVADRWLFSQFSLPFTNGPWYQMIAISQTSDPTGSWYRYQFSYSSMGDYPKFGVWPDAYYMTVNRFSGGGSYQGTAAVAFERAKMLIGDPSAQSVEFQMASGNEAYAMLPSDCDGAFPPMGTPGYIAYQPQHVNHIGIYEFHVDWTNINNSTFGNFITLPVNSFNGTVSGIPQKGTSQTLDPIPGRIMFRLQFRKFFDHWSMVTSATVNVGSNVAGVRWYELRNPLGSGWSIYQQGTYSPDNNSRWMGSIAMDSLGNIALGFSLSSSTIYPSIGYTGRLVSDPLNTMTVAEKRIINGQGYESYANGGNLRWGDYSSMSADPVAPGTFWYTQLYYVNSGESWQTRIASFSLGNAFSSYATATPAKTCTGKDSVQLNSFAYGGSGTYTWSWSSIPAGFTSNLQNPKTKPSVTTQYIVSVSDGSTTRIDSTNSVIIVPLPTSFAGNDTIVQPSDPSIVLNGVADNYKAILWETNGNGVFSSTTILNPTYTFGTLDELHNGVILTLLAFANSPCTGNTPSVRTIHINPLGIQENVNPELSLNIQPNPAHENVSLIINGLNNTTGTLTFMNLNGQTVYSTELAPSATTFTKLIDVTGFAKGIYLVKLITSTAVVTSKLVVQ